MQQVDSKGLLSKPEQVLARENVLDERAEVDAESNQLESNAGAKAREVGVLGQDALQDRELPRRPGLPLGVAFWVRSDEAANNQEENGEHFGNAGTVRNEVIGRGQVLQVAHENTPEELHSKRSCGRSRLVLRNSSLYVIGYLERRKHSQSDAIQK